jgi:IS4 transposase
MIWNVVIFDRGYFSYLLLHEFQKTSVHAIFRLQGGGLNKEVEAFIKSSQNDTVIEYVPSGSVISDLKKQGYYLKPKPLSLRLIKHIIKGETYIYRTTLLNKEMYPTSCFADVYHERWNIEELYKISKQIVDIEDFHARTERGVKQEIYAHLVLINLHDSLSLMLKRGCHL